MMDMTPHQQTRKKTAPLALLEARLALTLTWYQLLKYIYDIDVNIYFFIVNHVAYHTTVELMVISDIPRSTYERTRARH